MSNRDLILFSVAFVIFIVVLAVAADRGVERVNGAKTTSSPEILSDRELVATSHTVSNQALQQVLELARAMENGSFSGSELNAMAAGLGRPSAGGLGLSLDELQAAEAALQKQLRGQLGASFDQELRKAERLLQQALVQVKSSNPQLRDR